MSEEQEAKLLVEFEELVATDQLPREGEGFMDRVSQMVDGFLGSGRFTVAEDPFRGRDRELAESSHLFYVMFWRMFDQTPAALMQDFAIKLRRILAAKVFRSVGVDPVFHHKVLFSSGRNISIGNGVFVNRYVMLDDRAPIEIGDHTMIAAGVIIETHRHVIDDFSQPMPLGGRTTEPVKIGSNCLIGYNAVITAGTTIGDRAVVASNAVVTHDVGDRQAVGGVPARLIKVIEPR
ncbi:MAG: acyltransferase [Acidimicrobiia bacterium]